MNDEHLKGISEADQQNARLRDERAKSPDGMTASERAMARFTLKRYRCDRCGWVEKQRTNHAGPTWSHGRTNTCPECPPWAKYPEFGGKTKWTCIEKGTSA